MLGERGLDQAALAKHLGRSSHATTGLRIRIGSTLAVPHNAAATLASPVSTKEEDAMITERHHQPSSLLPVVDAGAKPYREPFPTAAQQSSGMRTFRRRGMMLATSAMLVPVLLLAGVVVANKEYAQHPAPASQSSAAVVAVAPALAVLPRTETLAATHAGLRLALTANPLTPGNNHLTLALSEHDVAVHGAAVQFSVRMVGMRMVPLSFAAVETAPGRFQATGLLAMFGPWEVTARIERPGQPPISQTFRVTLELPRGA